LIEAAAHGVPIVATSQGGPVDIIATLKNGLLVDPNDMAGEMSAWPIMELQESVNHPGISGKCDTS
jgi:glycosyltransferase involved in cell wall biosynthesis